MERVELWLIYMLVVIEKMEPSYNLLLCVTLFGEWMAMCPVYI